MPVPCGMYLPDADGEVHGKGAHLTGAPVFTFRTATRFNRDAVRGLSVSGGMTVVHDAMTGAPRMLVADGGPRIAGVATVTCWPGLARGRRR